MPIDEKLLEKAYASPHNLRFEEAVRLAEQLGFVFAKQTGSHRKFRHPSAPLSRDKYVRPLNLQRGASGKAKQYQVKQMLQMAEAFGVIPQR